MQHTDSKHKKTKVKLCYVVLESHEAYEYDLSSDDESDQDVRSPKQHASLLPPEDELEPFFD